MGIGDWGLGKFVITNKSSNDKERYVKELSLKDLKNNNNYFHQFDNLNNIEKEIEKCIKNKDIAIEDVSNKEIILKLKLLGNDNNIIKILLKKEDDDIIMILTNNYQELKRKDEIKDEKIEYLESQVKWLLNEMEKKNKEINLINQILNNINKYAYFKPEKNMGQMDDISKNIDKTNHLIIEQLNNLEATIRKKEIESENKNPKNNESINDNKNNNEEKISAAQNHINIEINNNKNIKEENKENNNLVNEKIKEPINNNNEKINKENQNIGDSIKIDNIKINDVNKILANPKDQKIRQPKISDNQEIEGNNQFQERIVEKKSDDNKLIDDKQSNNNNVILNKAQVQNINNKDQLDNQNQENIEPINQNNEVNIQPGNELITQNNKPEIKNSNFEKILKNSTIFESEEDIEFLLKNFHNKKTYLELLYNSKDEEENEEKLLNAYIDKEDLIFLIKTNESKRFGGYAHESFQKEEFMKKDKSAFLFNLDKKTIYKSKGKSFSIWRGSNTKNSINFGTGTDLKIYHNFLTEQSKTYQTENDYDYKEEKYALNGTDSFKIINFEIYKVKIQITN